MSLVEGEFGWENLRKFETVFSVAENVAEAVVASWAIAQLLPEWRFWSGECSDQADEGRRTKEVVKSQPRVAED